MLSLVVRRWSRDEDGWNNGIFLRPDHRFHPHLSAGERARAHACVCTLPPLALVPPIQVILVAEENKEGGKDPVVGSDTNAQELARNRNSRVKVSAWTQVVSGRRWRE